MAIGKMISDDYGRKATYHKIDKIEFDYLLDIISVTVNHYVDIEMRNVEKEAESDIQNEIDKYYTYKELFADDELTNRQTQEFCGMNIQELEAWKVPQTFMGSTIYKLEDTGIDFRENLYKEIVKIIPQLQNSKGV